jgi:hypothetical protein
MLSAKHKKILDELKDRLKVAQDEDGDNRKAAFDDLEFIYVPGKQWPAEIKADREANGRPCLEINKMPTFISQVVGDQRMNRPAIKVIPVDDKADKRVATLLSGWIKHVQQISKSDIAVDHAFEHAVSCGYGAMRVVTKYTSDSSFNQEAYIEKIENALAVYWGRHQEYDCSDAEYCIIITEMGRDEYKDTYKKEPMPFNSADALYTEGWANEKTVRLAEYFVKEPVKKTIYLLKDNRIVDELKEGDEEVKHREVETYEVKWYKCSGNEVLEEATWVGKKYIPIVPVWGKEINVGGKKIIEGLIRHGKDPQRMYNYWRALSLNTLIPTPSGWLTMENILVGQKVFDDKGKVCTVINISQVFENRKCLEVTFDDNSTIVADIKHLWTVEERGKRTSQTFNWENKTITTDQLVPGKHFINVTEPLDLPEQEYSIPPYVLGVWLGDGTSAEPNFTQHKDDALELSSHLKWFGCNLSDYHNDSGNCIRQTILGIRSKFTALGLLNNKHIPYSYVRGSKEQRLQLLQGLMDTDGSVSTTNGSCSFTTVELELAKGFAELLRTLGIKSKHCVRNRTAFNKLTNSSHRQIEYQFSFTTRLPVFRLSRKLAGLGNREEEARRTKRYSIKSIQEVPSVPVKCITVDSPTSLYLAGIGMVPTHNSTDTEVTALQPRVPYFITARQLGEHKTQWDNLQRKNYPYILVEIDKEAPGWPHREPPPQASSAMSENTATTDQEMRDTIGLQRASLGMHSNERSGVAIRERKQEGDVGTFSFIDNLSRSIEHLGRILVDIAPGILDTERVIRLGLDDGSYGFDAVNVEDPENPEKIINDLSVGSYDITVTVGPSFTTQRTEARQSMQEFIQYYPQAAGVIGDLYAKYQDWPGSEEVAQRLAFLLPPEIKAKMAADEAKKEGKEAPAPPPPPPPNPQQQMAMQEAQIKLQESQLSLEEAKLKLQQEQEKLKELIIKNEMLAAESKEQVRSLLGEVLKEEHDKLAALNQPAPQENSQPAEQPMPVQGDNQNA